MATEDARKLFVAGLPEAITEDVLRQLFEATGGKVVDVSLPRDRATGRPRGFGFVTFSTSEEAASARDSLDGSLQAGRAISVRPFSSEPPRRGEERTATAGPPAEDRTLYVGNLPYDISQQELTQLLTEAGVTPIARIHLPVGPDGRLRGFGFVTMATSEAANNAIIVMRNFEVRGRRVMANIAHPRGERGPGGPGGPSDRPRPPRSEGPGGWSPGGRAADPYPAPLPGMDFSGRPVEGRRARASGTGPAAGGGGGGGGGGGDWSDAKKKKGKKGARSAADTGKRRDDDDWKRNDWDDDD